MNNFDPYRLRVVPFNVLIDGNNQPQCEVIVKISKLQLLFFLQDF
jgi:hypothetical protein